MQKEDYIDYFPRELQKQEQITQKKLANRQMIILSISLRVPGGPVGLSWWHRQ